MSPTPLDPFSQGCGLTRPLVLVVTKPDTGTSATFELAQPYAVVGHSSDCHICLRDPRVSFRHVYLQAVGGGVFWVDLSSRTGTTWRGSPRPSGWLAVGDVLGVGGAEVRLAHAI